MFHTYANTNWQFYYTFITYIYDTVINTVWH